MGLLPLENAKQAILVAHLVVEADCFKTPPQENITTTPLVNPLIRPMSHTLCIAILNATTENTH